MKKVKQLTGQASNASETASSAAIVVSSPLRSGLSSHAGCSRRHNPNHRHFQSTGNINYDHQSFWESSSPRNHHTPHRQSQVSHIPGPCRGCSRRSRRRSGSQLWTFQRREADSPGRQLGGRYIMRQKMPQEKVSKCPNQSKAGKAYV